jgi:coiled-coil domain-containing protein 77
VSQEELHVTKWNVHKCEESISVLQRALSDANVLLHEERAQVLRLQTENERLRIQELEDRRRIQHLLALTQPVANDVTFFKDCRPSSMTRFPGAVSVPGEYDPFSPSTMQHAPVHDSSLCLNVNLEPKVSTPGGYNHYRTTPTCKEKHSTVSKNTSGKKGHRAAHNPNSSVAPRAPANHSVLKTVYLPNEKVDTLLLTIDNLRHELAQLKALSEEQVDSLLNDRQQSIASHIERENRFSESLKSLEAQLTENKLKLTHMTKDYLLLRYNAQKAQRVACEQIEESKQVHSWGIFSMFC